MPSKRHKDMIQDISEMSRNNLKYEYYKCLWDVLKTSREDDSKLE